MIHLTLKRPTIESNHAIRGKYNIPTIESKIRYKMYANWQNALPIAHLNNASYIHGELNQLNNDISTVPGNQLPNLPIEAEIYASSILIARCIIL